MNPTLSAIDLLEVIPAGTNPVRPGDVVLFRPPDWTQDVVHRITSIKEDWIRTRGDNSKEEDPWLLHYEEIQGIVTAAWRGDSKRKISGGRRGLLRAGLNRFGTKIDALISTPLRPFYRLASKLDFSMLLPPSLQPRVVTCRIQDPLSPGGRGQGEGAHAVIRRILIGKRIIGSYDNSREVWSIRRPYRLFISTPSPLRGEGRVRGL